MTESPLKFERKFQKLKSDIAALEAPDLRLLYLIDFWSELKIYRERSEYQSYFDEYFPSVHELISENNLADLSIEELKEIYDAISDMSDSFPGKDSGIITSTLAKKLFYVGEAEKALDILGAQLRLPDDIDSQTEFEILQFIYEKSQSEDQKLADFLQPILIEWQNELESVAPDTVNCLFVEKGGGARIGRGRMRRLEATNIETFGKSAKDDEITFEDIKVAPKDHFAGVAYDACDAVRRVFKAERLTHLSEAYYYHAHFTIQNGKHAFTGDSIGLAFALLTYTKLLKPEIKRHEKFISSDVVFTGGVDSDGNIIPVNPETLESKITRAFFSPVRYLVIPEANRRMAEKIINDMRRDYPRRKLRLIPAETLREVIDDPRVIRSDKVCMLPYITRIVYKYSRAAKIQIPILLVLIYFSLVLIDTKTFAPWWFDWHIDHIEVMGNRFRTLNFEGQEIWISGEYDANIDPEWYNLKRSQGRKSYWAVDVDGNGRDELFFTTWTPKLMGMLQFYSDRGILLWQKPGFKKTGYPGDTEYKNIPANMSYGIWEIIPIIDKDSNIYVMVSSEWSPPVRHQFLLFNTQGDVVSGPYINTGAPWVGPAVVMDNDSDGNPEVYVTATNNRLNRAVLLVLDPKNLAGASPPYDDELFHASSMQKGTQKYYVTFPETELSKGDDIRNYCAGLNWDPISQSYTIFVVEGSGLMVDGKVIYYDKDVLPGVCYRLDKNFIPLSSYFSDRKVDIFNEYLKKMRGRPITDPNKVLDSLLSDVIVYHGDTVVQHSSAGIAFYKNIK
jgi:hypothetical protein